MASSDSEQFYAELPVLDSFFDITDGRHFHPLPGDWYVGVTDIINSTKAIQNNQYKRVNILGASPIIGMMNASDKERLPYSFGGDGCALCFPPGLRAEVCSVFQASQHIGRKEYGLELRAAIIPLREIRSRSMDVRIARFRVSGEYSQAVFTGGGISLAEEMLKNPDHARYHITPPTGPIPQADFTGLECRWQEVHPPDKSVISLLVQCSPTVTRPGQVYRGVLGKMREIFGFDDHTNPVLASELKMHMMPSKLMGEVRFRTFGQGWLARLGYLLKVELQTLLGKIFMALGYHSSATDWSRYKPDLALNTDHRKFDDMLRLIISGTPAQQQELRNYLEARYRAGELAYGMHRADAAIITCMVFAYHRDHIHFVDGSNGGYVEAAKELKQRWNGLSAGDVAD